VTEKIDNAVHSQAEVVYVRSKLSPLAQHRDLKQSQLPPFPTQATSTLQLTVWSKFELEEFMAKLALMSNVIPNIKFRRHCFCTSTVYVL